MYRSNYLLTNIILLIISILLSIILLEMLLTIFCPQYNPSGKFIYYKNEDGLVLGPKNFSGRQWDNSGDFNVSISINKYGFRDKKDIINSSFSDIFVIGDSFCFGYGVEEEKRFSNILQTMLAKPVYNISMPGDFDDYDKLIKYAIHNGAKVNKLIVGVCMENDLDDYQNRVVRAYLVHNKISYLQEIKNFLDYRSSIYNVSAHIAHNNNNLKTLMERIGIINDPNRSRYKDILYNEIMANDKTMYTNIIMQSADRLSELVKGYDAIIVIIPSRMLWTGKHKDIENKKHNEFVRLVRNYHLKLIDLRDYFEEGANSLSYHYPNNGHWNEKGHYKASAIIYDFMKNH